MIDPLERAIKRRQDSVGHRLFQPGCGDTDLTAAFAGKAASLALPLTLGSSVIARAQLLARSACGFRRRMLWPLSIVSRLECPSVQTASTIHGETQDSGTPTPRPFRVSIAAAPTAKVGDLRASEPLELEALRVRWLPVASHPNGSMASECIMVSHSQCRHVGSFKNRCPIAHCLERRIAQCKRSPRPLD